MLGVVRRLPTVAAAVIPRMVVVPTRAFVSVRNFSNISNVISPKSEYSGRSEIVIEHEITVKKDVLSQVQHDVVPGAEDAPWTPKSEIGKTPMVRLNIMKSNATAVVTLGFPFRSSSARSLLSL
jgi:hypothetical protein